MIKPYWGADYDYCYGMILVFAENVNEAKKLTFNHFPNPEIEWTHVRVRRAEMKWMKFYDKTFPYVDTYEGDYESWEKYWQAEHENMEEA